MEQEEMQQRFLAMEMAQRVLMDKLDRMQAEHNVLLMIVRKIKPKSSYVRRALDKERDILERARLAEMM